MFWDARHGLHEIVSPINYGRVNEFAWWIMNRASEGDLYLEGRSRV